MSDKLLDYFNGDELAKNVWLDKYAMKGEETPDDMHRRLAKEIYRVDKKYQILANKVLEDYRNITGGDHKFLPFDPLTGKSRLSEYGVGRLDLTEQSIYEYLKDFKYIVPQGSVMSQLGSNSIGSLSNCFVIQSPEDSYGGIFNSDEEGAQLMKRRGGVGRDLSTLRPKGASTSNAAKSSTGVVAFAKRFSYTTREVAQDGRRGALMLSLSVDHPDVMEFITSKRDLTQITGANISVQLTNKFMVAVEEDLDYLLKFPTNQPFEEIVNVDSLEYNVLTAVDYGEVDCGKIAGYCYKGYVKKVKAKDVWDAIIESAHLSAEPGIMFYDNHIEYSPDSVYSEYKGVTTNPCGEIFMSPYDACRLLAINFFGVVKNPFTKKSHIDLPLLYEVSYEAMRISDNIVDLELEHIDKIIDKIKKDPETLDVRRVELELWKKVRSVARNSRRTGNGFTGLADMLAAMGISYNSFEGVQLVKDVMKVKFLAEYRCSIDLAIERGAFSGFSPEKEFNIIEGTVVSGQNEFYQMLLEEFTEDTERMIKYGRRNVSWSTVAPTGTVSIMTQTTSGIEPLFMPYYTRRKKINPNDKDVRVDFTDDNGDNWTEFTVLHPKFKDWIKYSMMVMSSRGLGKTVLTEPDVDDLLIRGLLTEKDINEWFERSPWYGSTANDISWPLRIRMQEVVQRYTTHSISSTLNLPRDTYKETISDIYKHAWHSNLKGVTVYREGSRDGVLINSDDTKLVTFGEHNSPKRPKSLSAVVMRFQNNKEKWVSIIGTLDDKPYEIFTGRAEEFNIPNSVEVGFITKYKDNGSKRYAFEYDGGEVENIAKIFNPEFYNYAKTISGVLRHGMPLPNVVDLVGSLHFPEDHINTWRVGVVRSLKKFIKNEKAKGYTCEVCGSTDIVFEEGCLKCTSCGSSKCG